MADFDLSEGVLFVRTMLDTVNEGEFRSYCDRLLEHPSRKLMIDLSGVKMIASTSIGTISALWVDVLSQERELELVVSAPVRKVLEYAGFHHVFTLIDAPSSPGRAQGSAHPVSG